MQGKNIIIGISGGIAAYKTPMLIREFVKRGANVKVVATKNALEFVTVQTLQTLSNNTVYYDMFSEYKTSPTEHISLALWGDCMVIAPATADIIGKYANAIADDTLSTTLLAFNKKIFFAPAMNENMYYNKGVQKNIGTLKSYGVEIIDSESGFLACGTDGKGRMADTDCIVQKVEQYFSCAKDFTGKTVMITAGPTREKIDSVRYISNNSSGKMGIAVAKEFFLRGAKVKLICGPVSSTVDINSKDFEIFRVESAQQMYDCAVTNFENADITICSAAVADYTPEISFQGKMKKKDNDLTITLKPTKDILKELGKRKNARQILVGFALETDNELENAKNKLAKKNLDLIVLNSLNDSGAGFEVDTNKVTLIDKKNNIIHLPLKSKQDVAKDIADKVKDFF